MESDEKTCKMDFTEREVAEMHLEGKVQMTQSILNILAAEIEKFIDGHAGDVSMDIIMNALCTLMAAGIYPAALPESVWKEDVIGSIAFSLKRLEEREKNGNQRSDDSQRVQSLQHDHPQQHRDGATLVLIPDVN